MLRLKINALRFFRKEAKIQIQTFEVKINSAADTDNVVEENGMHVFVREKKFS